MTDPRLERLARTLVDYSVEVKPGDTVQLTGDVAGLPLLRQTYHEVLRAGGYCVLSLTDEALQDAFVRHATDEQIAWISPMERWSAETATVRMFIRATNNTRAGSSVPPARMAQLARSRADLTRIRFARAASGEQRWTLTLFPTEALAQEADMSLEEYENFVYGATFCDQPDPVAHWRALGADQQKYVDWLKGRKNVVVRGPNVDLTLSIEGRTFINSDGKHNMPSGEIFTGPVEDSANGWVRFTYPAITSGRSVEGVELRFENGKVVLAAAAKNEDFLLAQLDTDAGARYLGEFAIGTNSGIDRFTGNILFDEKIGGTFHMALGKGYPKRAAKTTRPSTGT